MDRKDLFSSCMILSLFLGTFLSLVPETAIAHPPSDIVLDYNIDTGVLTVTITHNTPTPGYHYIENVEVSRNGMVQISQDYTSQPTMNTFSYEYQIVAVDGDVLSALARCNLAGELEGETTVTGPRLPLTIEVNPKITTIDEEAERSFTINAYSGSDPVDDVSFTITETLGTTSEVEPLGIGGYQFTYTAPDIDGDGTETLTIVGSRNGYDEASTELTFTVRDLDIPDDAISVQLEPAPSSVNEGSDTGFLVLLFAGGTAVSDAVVSVTAEIGEVSNIEEEDGGYAFTYSAPEVDADSMETLTVTAEKDGLQPGERTLEFTVLASREELDGIVSAGEYTFKTVTAGGDLEIHWRTGAGNLRMALRGRTSGWLSIGFGPTTLMKDADMVIGWVAQDGTVNVLDCHSTGNYGPHPPDTQLGGTDDIVSYGGSESSGWTVIEFVRPLDSPDDRYDNDIDPLEPQEVIWGMGSSDDPDDQHGTDLSSRGSLVMDLAKGDVRDVSRPVLWPMHAVLMGGAFVLMGASWAMLLLKAKTSWWLKAHKGLGIAGALTAVIGLAIGIYMVADAGSGHMSSLHSVFGALDAVMLLSSPAVGFLHFRLVKRTRRLRTAHIYLSIASLVLMAVVILMGLSRAGVF